MPTILDGQTISADEARQIFPTYTCSASFDGSVPEDFDASRIEDGDAFIAYISTHCARFDLVTEDGSRVCIFLDNARTSGRLETTGFAFELNTDAPRLTESDERAISRAIDGDLPGINDH